LSFLDSAWEQFFRKYKADNWRISGTGYIGSFTSLALLEHGYKVVIVDSLYNSSKVSLDRIELLCGKRPDFYQVDITDETALEKVFEAHPDIDSVIHFAALKV
jgi:UDP-glucose 4-epimerase